MEIQNKALFYTGLSFQILPIIGAIIFGLTFLNWDWIFAGLYIVKDWLAIIFKTANLKYYLLGLFIILYEVTSGLLIWAGLKK